MDGLETLVAPPHHHAFLLTESAAAAHFNVLSFDTCLFKSAASNLSNNFINSGTVQNLQTSMTEGSNGNSASAVKEVGNSDSRGEKQHPHLSILGSPGQIISHIGTKDSSQISESQQGDLNTPVTTSSDLPSFFGPSTVVEPPPITGK